MRRLYRNEKRYYRSLKRERERKTNTDTAVSFSSVVSCQPYLSTREFEYQFFFLRKGRRSTSVRCIYCLAKRRWNYARLLFYKLSKLSSFFLFFFLSSTADIINARGSVNWMSNNFSQFDINCTNRKNYKPILWIFRPVLGSQKVST